MPRRRNDARLQPPSRNDGEELPLNALQCHFSSPLSGRTPQHPSPRSHADSTTLETRRPECATDCLSQTAARPNRTSQHDIRILVARAPAETPGEEHRSAVFRKLYRLFHVSA